MIACATAACLSVARPPPSPAAAGGYRDVAAWRETRLGSSVASGAIVVMEENGFAVGKRMTGSKGIDRGGWKGEEDVEHGAGAGILVNRVMWEMVGNMARFRWRLSRLVDHDSGHCIGNR